MSNSSVVLASFVGNGFRSSRSSRSPATSRRRLVAAAALIAALLTGSCTEQSLTSLTKPRAQPTAPIVLEECAKSTIIRTGSFQAAFIGFGLGARFVPWRHVRDDGTRESSIRLSFGLVPGGGGFGDLMLGGAEFSERAYWQISSADADSLIAFLERLGALEFVDAGDSVDTRFVEGSWGSMRFRCSPNGAASVFVFTNQDGDEVWSEVDLGVLRTALQNAVQEMETLERGKPSVRFAGR
jgi:hypothetical protein